tara:strand:+ start:622 stop:831 length:210 start_codon:yes stop_codon:yes gene_type:complete
LIELYFIEKGQSSYEIRARLCSEYSFSGRFGKIKEILKVWRIDLSLELETQRLVETVSCLDGIFNLKSS